MRTSKLIIPATLAAIIGIGGSAAALTRSDAGETVSAVPTSVTTDVFDSDPSRILGADAIFDIAAPVLESQFAPIRRGSYRLGLGSAEVSLDFAADYWVIQENVEDLTVITDAGPSGPVGRDVILLVAMQPADHSNAIDGWLGDNAATVKDVQADASLGGRAAIRFDIDRSDDVGSALDFMATVSGEVFAFEPGFDYRVWWLENVEGEAVAVVVSSDGSSHPLLVQAEILLDTMAFAAAG